jgi:hypothetical protein
VWTGGTIPASGTSASVATNVTGSTTFTVRPNNGGGNGNQASTTVSVAGAGGGGGGGGGAISCPGYATTITMNFNYVAGTQLNQYTTGTTFGNGDIVVATFTTPANLANNGNGGNAAAIHYPGPNAVRTAVLSTSPCDFTGNSQGTNIKKVDSPLIWFSKNAFTGVVLQPSTTYYLNIKNVDSFGNPSCGSSDGNCPVQVTLTAK